MVGCKPTNEFGIYYRIQPFHSLLVSSKPKGRQFLISLLRFFFFKGNWNSCFLGSLTFWLSEACVEVCFQLCACCGSPRQSEGWAIKGQSQAWRWCQVFAAAALERSHLVLLTASAVQPFLLIAETDLLSSPAGAFQLLSSARALKTRPCRSHLDGGHGAMECPGVEA